MFTAKCFKSIILLMFLISINANASSKKESPWQDIGAAEKQKVIGALEEVVHQFLWGIGGYLDLVDGTVEVSHLDDLGTMYDYPVPVRQKNQLLSNCSKASFEVKDLDNRTTQSVELVFTLTKQKSVDVDRQLSESFITDDGETMVVSLVNNCSEVDAYPEIFVDRIVEFTGIHL